MANSTPIRKKTSSWLKYLFFAGLGVAAVFVVEVTVLNIFASPFPTLIRGMAIVIPVIVLLGFILIFTLGTKIIPWRYTIFCPYERTPPPKGFQAHIRLGVARQRHSYITGFGVGKEGIEVYFLSGSPGFIPADSITAIGPAAWRTYMWSNTTVPKSRVHSS